VVLKRLVTIALAALLIVPSGGSAARADDSSPGGGKNNTFIYVLGGLLAAGAALIIHRRAAGPPPPPPIPAPVPPAPPAEVRPSPSPSPSPVAVVPPSPPAPTKTDEPCSYKVVDGWFQPSQGVWQDDAIFPDLPGKQLVRDPAAGPVAYHAELPLVAGRETVLFGVQHYVLDGKEVRTGGIHPEIEIKYETDCSRVDAVAFQFTASQHLNTVARWEEPDNIIVFDRGPRTERRVLTVTLPVETGTPYRAGTGPIFRSGPYRFDAELVRSNDGSGTGIAMSVDGQVTETHGFSVHIIPVSIARWDPPQRPALEKFAKLVSAHDVAGVPDYFPLPPHTITPVVEDYLNLTGANIEDVSSILGNTATTNARDEALLAALGDRMSVAAMLENAGRIVVLVSIETFNTIFDLHNPGEMGSGAYTSTTKFSLPAYTTSDGAAIRAQTVGFKMILTPRGSSNSAHFAHELTHTLPDGWAEHEMESECKHPHYHDNHKRWANGVRLYDDGQPVRKLYSNTMAVMSSPWPPDAWMTQCTYWHLTKELSGSVPDPTMLTIRGFLHQGTAGLAGAFGRFYQVDGTPSVHQMRPGAVRVILRDAAGAALKTYRFAPDWKLSESPVYQRSFTSFAYSVPWDPRVVRADLVGPKGQLDSVRFTAAAPTVAFSTIQTSVRNGERYATLGWTAHGERALRSSVLYSPDAGKTWLLREFELPGTSATVHLGHGRANDTLKLIVTDGTRSGQAVRTLTFK
jgi:hypothetical protein